MTNEEFISAMESSSQTKCGGEVHLKMHELSQRALRITALINGSYHEPSELRSLMEQLTGQSLDERFGLFPPFYTDCGINIHIGRGVFINAGCKFQDQGGIYIGDNCLIGHGTIIATLDHGMLPDERGDLIPSPVHIGKGVWIGSGSIILSGVTIGDNAVIGAGSVVTKDIPADMVAVGSPAKVIKSIYE
ncbi:sugar O-acetyltransferase [uncultured Ruminococcus sp.]|uniref:sugar O-acetyltransferase n=1 Tax=uncultured Ruminococcus sp. TaxID=165186 RepID=UPI000EEB2430|nr:sugar O-acetyltransferase [uncultured Ruminococcus sp.]HCJ40404.1 acetyltransferase [Ruminococcus sp.]